MTPHTSWGKTSICHHQQLCWGAAPHHPFGQDKEHSEGASVSNSPTPSKMSRCTMINGYNSGEMGDQAIRPCNRQGLIKGSHNKQVSNDTSGETNKSRHKKVTSFRRVGHNGLHRNQMEHYKRTVMSRGKQSRPDTKKSYKLQAGGSQ